MKIIHPTYVTKQPSTGKSITYRPFTVKEEKSLLLALQEDNIETVVQAIKNVISACTDIDPDSVPYYDVEYLFLQIRAKSVGEIIDLIGSCSCEPDTTTPFSVDISNLKILPEPTGNVKIKVVDTEYTIECMHPTISDFSKSLIDSENSALGVVANCIVYVYTDDEIMDWTYEEKLEFVESMTPKQQVLVAKFLETMPMVKLDTSYTCKKCNLRHENSTSGFASFFV